MLIPPAASVAPSSRPIPFGVSHLPEHCSFTNV